MMRTTFGAGLITASIFAACSFGTSSEPSTGTSVDAGSSGSVTPPVKCGDGVCSATEVNTCPQDCGTGGNGSGTPDAGSTGAAVCGNAVCEAGEDAGSCPLDCSGGGSGSGGGIDCTDFATLLACLDCIDDATACTPPLTQAACNACLGSP